MCKPPPQREQHDGQRLRQVIKRTGSAVESREILVDVLIDKGDVGDVETAGNGVIEQYGGTQNGYTDMISFLAMHSLLTQSLKQ